MNTDSVLKSTQEQAVAAWIGHLNKLRFDGLVANLAKQDINFEGAMEELFKLKEFVGNPSHILGNPLSKHGEIAEHVQANISNARRLIEGLKGEYTFEGVGRTAPEDYMYNGSPIQSKFYTGDMGNKTFKAINDHLGKYPDFIKNGGKYDIPKDQYEKISELLEKPLSGLRRSEYGFVRQIREWEETNGVSFSEKINPSVIDYADAQQGQINETIDKEQKNIEETDKGRREGMYQESKPSLKQGLTATGISAVIEGGMSFCLGVSKKLKSGKKLYGFTGQDWQEVGIDTAKGSAKGAIRGASVYTLANFTATPAAVASALVTAAFGMASQAQLLGRGGITPEEFIENSEVICLDVTISAISSVMGQALIPVPVLGAIIGNAAGMFMCNIAKDHLGKKEQELLKGYMDDSIRLTEQIEESQREFIEILDNEFAKFNSAVELAFDVNINLAFNASVSLARQIGCADNSILKNKKEIDEYFLN